MFIFSKINFLGAISQVLLLLLVNTVGTESAQGSQIQDEKTLTVFSEILVPQVAANPSELEQQILKEINRARTNPQEYAAWLEGLKSYYDGNIFKFPGEREIRTNRGLKVLEEAIIFVKKQRPLSALTNSEDLTLTAKEKLTNFIENKRNQDLSNISYGKVTPEAIVMQLVVDDRYRDRRHRLAIFNPNYGFTGVVCQKDRRYTQVCAIAISIIHN